MMRYAGLEVPPEETERPEGEQKGPGVDDDAWPPPPGGAFGRERPAERRAPGTLPGKVGP